MKFDFVDKLPGDLQDAVKWALQQVAIVKPFLRFLDQDDRGEIAYFIGRQVLAGMKRVGWDSTANREFLNATLNRLFKLPTGHDYFKWDDDPPE
jgi:hypothetical protein